MPRAPTAALLADADALLSSSSFEDYCVNGLQVPGPPHTQRLVTGVSANLELFERAADEGADLLLVHHGLFWGAGVRTIDAPLAARLRVLFEANIALAAYHLPLDAHPDIGNNALLARALEATDRAPFALHHGQPIGCVATLAGDDGLDAADVFARVAAITERQPLTFDFGPPRVGRVAIVSGAGADYLPAAAAAGAQALLTGEVSERSMAIARELGLHLIAAGHYATETFGVRALGQRLAERFNVEHSFIDVPNPI